MNVRRWTLYHNRTRFFCRNGVLLVCGLVLTGGCSRVVERHYFKLGGGNGMQPNFYRVQVTGASLLSSSRYISGHFDADAINTYFNEFTQPDKGQIIASKPATELGQTNPNSQLLLIMSSNSDDIANGISSLAQSSDVTKTLSNMITRDRIERSKQSAANNTQAEADALATLGDTLVTKATAVNANDNMLAYVRALASYLSPGTTIEDFDKAQAWLKEYQKNYGGH